MVGCTIIPLTTPITGTKFTFVIFNTTIEQPSYKILRERQEVVYHSQTYHKKLFITPKSTTRY